MTSLAVRAVLALVLTVVFYAVALGLAGGLLYLPYAEWTYGHRVHVRLAIPCFLGAGLILWSIAPWREVIPIRGARLDLARQPRLAKVLKSLSTVTGQPMPAEVFLVPELNAWVLQRGGILGFGGQRILGIGLPLLEVLSIAQLRAVLLHEYGHWSAGDTRFAAWIYRARIAIGRTITRLSGRVGLLHLPFLLYGRLFALITDAVSRQQELAADRFAAEIAGARTSTDALLRVHGAAGAFEVYWDVEVAPVLHAGYLPPVGAGFRHFLSQPYMPRRADEEIARQLGQSSADPFDTHPPLAERVEALKRWTRSQKHAVDDTPAAALLDDRASLEHVLVGLLLVHAGTPRKLEPIEWPSVGDKLLLPTWIAEARDFEHLVRDVTADEIPGALARVATPNDVRTLPDCAGATQRRSTARAIFAAALGQALVANGWRPEKKPGERAACVLSNARVEPNVVITDLVAGNLSATAWRERCRELGIEGLSLAVARDAGS